ncbi:MAG: hypothetical protein ACXWZM_10030, partial [Solirubrobacterales bacterium]
LGVLGVIVLALGSLGAGAALGALSENSEQKFIPYNVFGDVTASCGHRKHVAFGGFKTDTIVPFQAKQNLWPASMGPVGRDTNKWSTVAASPSIGGGKLTSIAYCKAGNEPKVVRKRKIVLQSAANDELRKVSVTCPPGKNVIGGGWAARTASPLYFTDDSQPYLNIMGLQRTSNRTWQVSVVNQRPKQHAVTAIALCGKGAAPKTSVATVNFPSRSSTMKTATATCPGKTEVVFGGFKGDFDSLSGRNAFIFSFYRSSKKAISVRGGQNYVFGNTQTPKLQAIAYCR